MTTMIKRTLLALLLLTGSVGALADDVAGEEAQFSDAEKMMWLGNQLGEVKSPSRLGYSFVRSGTYEQGFTDTVELEITRIKPNGLKDGVLRFFSGERNFPVPPAEDTDANPVLKIYFQGDVYEMNRLTDPDGKSRERWRYFQRRIKLALAESATITPTEFEFDGKKFAGRKIQFQPYVKDPKRAEFEKFADKAYAITVSDQLPGYVYKIETVIPGPGGQPPLVHEVLTLESVSALPAAKTASSAPRKPQ